MPLQQIHLRINDAATGKQTPVRLRITDADGTYYAPYGRLTEFATGVNQDVGGNVMIGSKKWAYIDGTCEILLPPGRLHIEITKGPEYTPIDEEITLLAGKLSLRFTIERWSDVRKQGWYSGDTRVHFLSPDAALLEGEAEDVAIVNLLAKEAEVPDMEGDKRKSISNILSFSGQQFARQSPLCGVAVNTHNIHSGLGSLGLLHCHRVVFPLSSDGDVWILDDWCGQCHRKKGLVVWTCQSDFQYGEPLVCLVLGNIDSFEITSFQDRECEALADFYTLLDAGLGCSLVGGSGKDSNEVLLGAMRTYAFLPPEERVEYTAWIEAIRAGRTFISNGPLLFCSIDEQIPGSVISLAANRPLCIRAEGRCLSPFLLELLWNGEVIATAPSNNRSAEMQLEHLPTGSGWLALRCRGHSAVAGQRVEQRLFAHTSPVFIHYQGMPPGGTKCAVHFLKSEIGLLSGWNPRLTRNIEAARTVLARKLS